LQGDHSHFTVVVNRLLSDEIGDNTSSTPASHPGKSTPSDNINTIRHTAKHGYKLLFPTYGLSEDPLPWLNHCDQFFCIQEMTDAGEVFLASFYMSREASHWFSLLERNQEKPS
jgi:hypothetical protein